MFRIIKLLGLCIYLFNTPLFAYSALIFDCDGVLVDTEHLKYLAWKKALVREGIAFDRASYLPLVGLSSPDIAKQIKSSTQQDFNCEELIARKNQIYSRMQKRGVPLMLEGIDFLKTALSHKATLGIKVGIASSASHQEINENLHQMGLTPEAFDIILSGKDDLTHIQDPSGVNKPKPYIYQLCAKRLNLSPHQIVVFEDSASGVEAAYLAGIDVIAIPNAFTAHHDFSHATKISSFSTLNLDEMTTRTEHGKPLGLSEVDPSVDKF